MKIVITGGATRNKVDAIRYLSAHATGKTAVELACLLGGVDGTEVTLLGSAEALLRYDARWRRDMMDYAEVEEFMGTRDLMARMERLVPEADVVIHSAAVGDYEVDATDAKIPSGQAEVTLTLRPAPKILDRVRTWNPHCVLVSFKACGPGTRNMEEIALAQLRRTGSDVVFANVIGAQDLVAIVREGITSYYTREEGIRFLVETVLYLTKTKKAAAK